MAATQQATADAAAPADRGGLLRIEGARGRYTRVPNALLDDTTLTARQRDLWALIHRRDWQGEGWVFTHKELAHIAGCGIATLARTLKALEARGLVRTEGPAKRPKRYFALVPEGPKGGPPEDLQAGSESPHLIDPNHQNDRSDPPQMIDPNPHDDRSAPEIPYMNQKRSKTNQSAAAQHAAALPASERKEPSHDGAGTITPAGVAVAVLAARGQVATPRAVGRLLRMCAEEVSVPYSGRASEQDIAACLAYMRTKPYFAASPHLLTPQRLGEDFGPWLHAGKPAHYTPPVATIRPRRPHPDDEHVVCQPRQGRQCECHAFLDQGAQHTLHCVLWGPATSDNYVDTKAKEVVYSEPRYVREQFREHFLLPEDRAL